MFSGMTIEEAGNYMGLIEDNTSEPRPSKEAEILAPFLTIPKSFDSRV